MPTSFDELHRFITHDMRMSHIYQPVMLVELLERGGTASVTQIARAILQHDPSQIEYYEQITRQMPGRVLTKNRGITTKEGDSYHLTAFEELSKEEIQALIPTRQSALLTVKTVSKHHWGSKRIDSS